MAISIRNERAGDAEQIHRVTELAFRDASRSGRPEQLIVEALAGLVYPGAPAEYFQGRSFDGSFPQGEVTYHAAFSARG